MRGVFSFCFTEQHKLSLLRPSEDERKIKNSEKWRRIEKKSKREKCEDLLGERE